VIRFLLGSLAESTERKMGKKPAQKM